MSISIRNTMFLAAVGTALLSVASQAAPVLPNQNVFAVNEPGPVGGVVIANLTVPLITATFTGSLTSTVVAGDLSNPLGGLTFTYAIQNDANSAHSITRLAVNGFFGTATDMSFNNATGTLAPTLNDRDAGGNVIGFRYVGAPIGPGTIAPGTLTNLMVVQTNASLFRPTLADVIDGSVATIESFSPLIPEPVSASAVLLTAGLVRRRR